MKRDPKITPSEYRSLFETMSQGVVFQNADGEIIDANPAAERILGISLDQMQGLTSMDPRWRAIREDGSDFPGKEHPIPVALRTGKEVLDVVHGVFHPQKETMIWIKVSAHPLFRPGEEKPYQAYATFEDITERVEAEETLREREQQLRVLSDNLPDGGMYQIDTGTNGALRQVMYLSAGMKRLHGVPIEDVMDGVSVIYNQIPKPDIDRLAEAEAKAISSMTPFQSEARVCLPSGEVRIRLFKSAPRRLANNHVVWDGIELDITNLKQAEHESSILRRFIDVLSESAFWLGTDNRFTYVNDAACESLGYSRDELLTMTLDEISPQATPETTRKLWSVLREKGLIVKESVHRKKDGTDFPVEIRSNYAVLDGQEYCCGFAVDITNRKKVEEALANTQKLESLGALAGGIAHDFNNLLGGVFGYVDLAADSTRDPTVLEYLSKAMGSVERARDLTHQLLTFAKGGNPVKTTGSIADCVRENAQFASSGSKSFCRFDIPGNLWPCEFDKNQIGQVIGNIVINAQQAMPDGGEIEIHAMNVRLGDSERRALMPGNYVKIAIADCGVGMHKEMLPRIFDPFFTTKPNGHGLGLATCYSIVKRHGGCIEVESHPGKGSTFSILIPAVPDALLNKEKGALVVHYGSGVVLIMDDEEVIRKTTGEMLRRLGYTPIYATSGSEAVELLTRDRAEKQEIYAMIFDLTVPGGMGGVEAVARIRAMHVDIPAFVSSGYADDPVMANPSAFGFTSSICKPFRITELSNMLNQYLKPEG